MKKEINHILGKFGYRLSRVVPLLEQDDFGKQKMLAGTDGREITIVDAGAYTGEVSIKYATLFPGSTIYSLEPFPESFAKLRQNTRQFNNIYPVNCGLGNYSGKSLLQSNLSPATNSLLGAEKTGSEIWGNGLLDNIGKVEIELLTLDDFVEKNKIRQVDILKLDVQGAEYLVLEGGKGVIGKGLVRLIFTEIITMPTYSGQKHLDELLELMRSLGFKLFNFYNLSNTREGRLRQLDAIFIYSNH